MKKLINSIFFTIFSFYFLFLCYNLIRERSERIIITFFVCFFIINFLLLITPKVILFLQIFKNFFKNEKETYFKKKIKQVKDFCLLSLLKIKEVFNDFFENLGEILIFKRFCYFTVIFMEKAVRFQKITLFFIVILPQILLFLSFSLELAQNKDTFLVSLYFLTLVSTIRIFFTFFIIMGQKFTLTPGYVDLLIYFPKIKGNNKCLKLFTNNFELKSQMLDTEGLEINEIEILWKIFSKFNYFYSLKLKIDFLKSNLQLIQKLIRKVNLILVGNLLLFFFFDSFLLWVSLVFSICLIFILTFQFYSYKPQSDVLKYDAYFPDMIKNCFIKKKEELQRKFPAISLPYPYVNEKTAKLLAQEHFELLKIIQENENLSDDATRFDEFSRFSDYLFSKNTFLKVDDAEQFIMEFFYILEENDLIDPDTFKIKAEKERN